MPSARALRSNLRSLALPPITAAIPIASARKLAPRFAWQGWLSGRRLVSDAVHGGTAHGVRAGGEKYAT